MDTFTPGDIAHLDARMLIAFALFIALGVATCDLAALWRE